MFSGSVKSPPTGPQTLRDRGVRVRVISSRTGRSVTRSGKMVQGIDADGADEDTGASRGLLQVGEPACSRTASATNCQVIADERGV